MLPGPCSGGPDSMFQDEGASTEVTWTFEAARASITGPKGSRTSPSNEKPKMASITWSVSMRALWKSSTNGTWRFFSCVERRWVVVSQSFLGRLISGSRDPANVAPKRVRTVLE